LVDTMCFDRIKGESSKARADACNALGRTQPAAGCGNL